MVAYKLWGYKDKLVILCEYLLFYAQRQGDFATNQNWSDEAGEALTDVSYSTEQQQQNNNNF